MLVETSLVKIGNSEGLIISKRLLNKLGSAKTFDIQEKEGCLIFVPFQKEKPRERCHCSSIQLPRPEGRDGEKEIR